MFRFQFRDLNGLKSKSGRKHTPIKIQFYPLNLRDPFFGTPCILYRDLDHDREGRLTRNEMRGFLLNMTDRKGEVERFLETVDEDNKGFVLHEGKTAWYYSLIILIDTSLACITNTGCLKKRVKWPI